MLRRWRTVGIAAALGLLGLVILAAMLEFLAPDAPADSPRGLVAASDRLSN